MLSLGDGQRSAAASSRLPRYRFSLRTLLILITAIAFASSWVGLPLIHARRFEQRIAAQDFTGAAEGFALAADHRMLSEWSPIVRASVRAKSLTLQEIVTGRRHLELTVTYRLNDGREFPMRFDMGADRGGIHCLSGLPPIR